MHYNNLVRAVALLSTTGIATAQTFAECGPSKGKKCPNNPAFGNCRNEVSFDFSTVAKGDGWKKDKNFNDFWTPDQGIVFDDSPLSINGDNGAIMTITNDKHAPLIKTNKSLFFGKVEVVVKAAPGVGIVTSVVLESNDGDELDWEWIGGEQTNVQTNFFSKGLNEFVHGKTHAIGFNAMEGLHSYTIEWTPDFMAFSVDGKEIRRAGPAEAENGAKWPQTPVQVKLGTWVGGKPSNPDGTIEWAGGLADFKQAPFIGWYKSVKITDYCGGKDKATEYVYTDVSGRMDTIEVKGSSEDVGFGGPGGDDSDDDEDDTTTEDNTTAKPTASKTSSDGASETSDAEPTNAPDSDSDGADGAGAGQEGEGEGGEDDSAAPVQGVSSALAAVVLLGYLVLA